ncbi:MAG TPA: transposase [Mycobacterium sp.]|nr:transposase [Mycobacterium sp.]
MQPGVEEISDSEHELLVARVAAIDVAKASGKVCVRLPGQAGRRVSRVWDVAATSGAVSELAEQLVGQSIEKVTVESTSDYWRIWYYLLEAAGLSVQLVNARDVKNVPGRAKTDKLDAVWLAKLTEKGLLRPSFVPPPPIRRLRDYTRLRTDLTHDRSRQVQRLEKLLADRPDQAFVGGHRHHGRVRARHARSADRRTARSQGTRRPGTQEDEDQTLGFGRRPRRPV